MKAKEYYQRYLDSGCSNECLTQTLSDFLAETQYLFRIRGCRSSQSRANVYKEMDIRWKKLCGLHTDFPELAYPLAIAQSPDVSLVAFFVWRHQSVDQFLKDTLPVEEPFEPESLYE